ARVDQLGQRQSSLLSAGKISHVFVNIITKEEKLRQKGPQLSRRGIRRRDQTELHYYLVAIVEVLELLRVVTNFHLRTPTHFACQRGNLAEHCSHEGSLARSVRSNDAEAFAAPKNQRNVAGQNLAGVANSRFGYGKHVRSGAFAFL